MSRRALLADIALPLVVVLLLAGGAFAVTGAWPPVVAVESGSMEPHTSTGDLVVVTAPDRYEGPAPGLVGAADVEHGEYERLGGPGDVIVFDVPETDGPPILHRVAFHVEEGENWYDRADPALHEAESCQALRHCPAPYDGYITYGDANGEYDQANGLAPPVKDEWVVAKAQVRVPKLGWVRIVLGEFLGDGSVVSGPFTVGGSDPVHHECDESPFELPAGTEFSTCPVYTSPSSVMESVAALRSASDLPNSPGEMATVRIP